MVTSSIDVLPITGVRIGTFDAGLRYQNRKDLVVFELVAESRVAAVFTKNLFCAAPVQLAKRHLAKMTPKALLINTGFANAGTGQKGIIDAEESCQALANQLGCQAEQVLPFSTGVIGERIPMSRLLSGLSGAVENLSEEGWQDAAQGILTTDTRPKLFSRVVDGPDGPLTLTGIAKGAGMICPNMATMLAFIATDARLSGEQLDLLLKEAVADSFNAISIDGDTSTNDACVLVSTGAAMQADLYTDGPFYVGFVQALNGLCQDLAKALVEDAEGATKLIEVTVSGALNRQEARTVGYTIAHSPLVKTAFYASDPNWGRILAAIGRAPIDALDVSKVGFCLNGLPVVEAGSIADSYTEEAGQAAVQPREIRLHITLQRGTASASVWTSDLSHEYVSINADYRS